MYKRHIETLLRAIDERDWIALEGLLHPDSSYEVPGFPSYRGRAAIMDYYRHVRPIESGRHELEFMVAEGLRVVACGRFTGLKRDGSQVALLFADAVAFDEGLIISRRVYFH